MLPAGNRLRRRQDFATAVRRGRRAGRGSLVAHLYSGDSGCAPQAPAGNDTLDPHAVETVDNSASPVRAGFVVSRAVGRATVRSTVKRRLRHVVRERLDRLPAGSVLVVRALPPAANASSTRLAGDLDAALLRLLGVERRSR